MNYDARRPASGLSSLTAKNRTPSAITPLPLTSEILCLDPVFLAVSTLSTLMAGPTHYPSPKACLSSQEGASA